MTALRSRFVVGALLLMACEGRMNGGATGLTDPSASTNGSIATSQTPVDGLPCDVVALLQSSCLSCHGNSSTLVSLTSRDALLAKAASDPTKTVAEVMLARLNDGTMPPMGSPSPTAAEVSALSAWVAAGEPVGNCAAPDAGPDPFALPPTCTSGRFWTLGNEGANGMNPGEACISCHQRSGGEAPSYVLAGTVYDTGHEPDLCLSSTASTATTVEITDAANHVFTTAVGSNGNFSFSSRRLTGFTLPYRARIIRNGSSRAMATAQTSGDCNSCHTAAGTEMAPGRMVAP